MEEKWESLAFMDLHEYVVSTYGRIFNIKTNQELKGFISGGYKMIGFRDNNRKRFNHPIHRLVALTFIPYNGSKDITVDHIDRNKLNNNVTNLRWATRSEQVYNQNKTNPRAKVGLQYNINGTLLKVWKSAMEASSSLSIDESSIRKCCKGYYPTVGGYKWKYEDKYSGLTEEWKKIPIPIYGDIFTSSLGRIKPLSGNPTPGHKAGCYMSVSLKNMVTGKMDAKTVHRLVATAFYGLHEELIVNHKNGDKLDNRSDNLEFITQRENVIHSINTGLTDMSKQYKSVICIHPDKDIMIKRYNSIVQATNETNATHGNIIKVCKGERNMAGGYRWMYDDDPKAKLLSSMDLSIYDINLEPKKLILKIISATYPSTCNINLEPKKLTLKII